VSGTFETRWGTLEEEDPLGTGSGSLEASVGGDALAVATVGAAAGPDPDDGRRAGLDVVAVLEDGTVVVAWFALAPHLVEAGTEVALELGGADSGALFHLDPTSGTWSTIGILQGGTLSFEEAGTTEGATIRARFDADVVDVPWL
jgi:hypothetical protein